MTSKTDESRSFLPYGRQLLEADDIAAVIEVLRSDWLTTGPMVARFEEAFARQVGVRRAIACSSGTAALHLAVMALDLGPGDFAIVPAITFLATANVVRFTGAEVVFADVDPQSGLLSPDSLAAALARAPSRVKAVLPVHLGGLVVEMPAVAAIAKENHLAVIEDACHALGAAQDGVPIGACAHSDMATFSTHPVKSITTGEGGMITVNDDARAERLRRLRSHGMEHDAARWQDPDLGSEHGTAAPWHYEMAEIGYNYRLTDIASALGLSQLKKLGRFVARRAHLAALYDRLLAPLATRVGTPMPSALDQPSWHLYAVRIDFAAFGTRRSDVMRKLRERGIGTQVHYIPVHKQPYYAQRYGALSLPGADAYFAQTLSLPLFPAMQDGDVTRVVEALATALGRR
jgi:UDP-4-amino-4,6-dideoxy-N-acetyl-beta-L-altrosamine transaminase